jgi:3-oxoacyl-(acyl-carrier-protein) synthase
VSQRRIVVTGLGLLSPVGNTVVESWNAICNGRSGIDLITEFDVSQLATRIAGEIRNFEVTDFIPGKDARRYDKFMHYGLAASQEAMSEAGLFDDDNGIDPERVGFAIAAGIGGISTIENTMMIYRDRGARRVSPFYIPGSIVNMIGGALSIRYGYKGPNIAVTQRHQRQWRALSQPRPCRPAMTILRQPVVPGIGTGMVLFCPMEPALSWSKNSNTQSSVAPLYMPRLPDSA